MEHVFKIICVDFGPILIFVMEIHSFRWSRLRKFDILRLLHIVEGAFHEKKHFFL